MPEKKKTRPSPKWGYMACCGCACSNNLFEVIFCFFYQLWGYMGVGLGAFTIIPTHRSCRNRSELDNKAVVQRHNTTMDTHSVLYNKSLLAMFQEA